MEYLRVVVGGVEADAAEDKATDEDDVEPHDESVQQWSLADSEHEGG